MVTQRWRPVILAVGALLIIWAVAITGFSIARNSKVTAEKVRAYVESTDLRKLKGEARAKALRKLADMLNRLSIEERRQARMERLASDWFNEMTEEEKAQFIEATMPTGFKQMLTAFEQLPEDKRKRAVDDALRRIAESERILQPARQQKRMAAGTPLVMPAAEQQRLLAFLCAQTQNGIGLGVVLPEVATVGMVIDRLKINAVPRRDLVLQLQREGELIEIIVRPVAIE